ncbi:hypothetical protein C8R48DRAFT_670955 [Suillus tomentosus]|nr:hypothetical protein C8R48DRAFT_670955 [Suillus tomentosus]
MELVIYSCDVKHPVSHTTRTRVMPTGIAQFLRHRRTSWECFCSAMEERATPVCFVSTMNGFTKAVCYFRNNKCSFSINLNEMCHTVHHISTYEDWPVFQATANTATLITRCRHSAVFPTVRDQLLGHAHHPVQHPMQHVEPDVLVVPPKDVPDLPMVQEGPILSPNKQDHLFKLAAGGGIHMFDANCLLEKCDGSRRVFIPTVLRLHIIEGCGKR